MRVLKFKINTKRTKVRSNVKNVPKKWFLFVIFSRLLLDGIAGLKFIIELRPIHTFAIMKAHMSLYKNLYPFLQKRKKTSKKPYYFKHLSVVYQHFILNIKKFKKLN